MRPVIAGENRAPRPLGRLVRGAIYYLENVLGAAGWCAGAFLMAAGIAEATLDHDIVASAFDVGLAALSLGVVGVTIWRRGLNRWTAGFGVRLGLWSALGFGLLEAVTWSESGTAPLVVFGGAALFSLGLSAGCVIHQRDAVGERVRRWFDGADCERDCLTEGIVPALWLGGLGLALFAVMDPAAVIHGLDTVLRAPPGKVPYPSLLVICQIALAAAVMLGAAFYTSLRRCGRGSATRGITVWLTAFGQVAGFGIAVLGFGWVFISATGQGMAWPIDGWIALATAVAGLAGLGCYWLRRRQAAQLMPEPLVAGSPS